MILLDTHALIWMSAEPTRLSKPARTAVKTARQSGGLAVAAITLWELALLAQRGRIQIPGTVESFVRETVSRVIVHPITPEIASAATGLPESYPRDPADRLIGATAMIHGISLVTADEAIQDAKIIRTIW